jgi:hypothetical protein
MSSNLIFSDTQNHWANDCISQLVARNFISGYPDGSFRPNASVTRAEFAALLSKAFANTPPIRSAITFKDVSSITGQILLFRLLIGLVFSLATLMARLDLTSQFRECRCW